MNCFCLGSWEGKRQGLEAEEDGSGHPGARCTLHSVSCSHAPTAHPILPTTPAQVSELEARAGSLDEERAALESRLGETEGRLAEARAQGTPAGEGAKTVSRLALQRVRDLQEVEAGLRAELAAKAAALEQLEGELARLLCDTQALQEAVAGLEAGVAEVCWGCFGRLGLGVLRCVKKGLRSELWWAWRGARSLAGVHGSGMLQRRNPELRPQSAWHGAPWHEPAARGWTNGSRNILPMYTGLAVLPHPCAPPHQNHAVPPSPSPPQKITWQSAAAVTNLERRLEESAARRAELEAALAAARAMATGEGHRADAAAAEIVALRSELAGAGGALEAARAAHARDQEEGAARCEELAARLAEVREAGRQLAELKSGAEARAAALESELEELKVIGGCRRGCRMRGWGRLFVGADMLGMYAERAFWVVPHWSHGGLGLKIRAMSEHACAGPGGEIRPTQTRHKLIRAPHLPSYLQQAPPAGTPVGNASKQVVRLSFAKIQEMREREAEQGERVAALEVGNAGGDLAPYPRRRIPNSVADSRATIPADHPPHPLHPSPSNISTPRDRLRWRRRGPSWRRRRPRCRPGRRRCRRS